MVSLIFAIFKPKAKHWVIRFPGFHSAFRGTLEGFNESHKPVPSVDSDNSMLVCFQSGESSIDRCFHAHQFVLSKMK